MTTRCIRSVLDNQYGNKSVLVVDNGSREPCGELIQQQHPEIEVLALSSNRGFTGGANAGLQAAMDRGADYIFFLNNDTVVDSTAIGHLVDGMEENPRCAIASALLVNPAPNEADRTVQAYSAEVDRDLAIIYRDREFENLEGEEWPNRESDYVPACAILLRPLALHQFGLFDEKLGTNWEDYDLCLRAQDAGWAVMTIGDARVVHFRGQTTGRDNPYLTYYKTRNRLICLWRYGSLVGTFRKSPMLLRSFIWQIRNYGLFNWRCHWAFLSGIVHFVVGIRGRRPSERRT